MVVSVDWRESLASSRLWAANEQPYLATTLFALTAVERSGLGTFGVDTRWRLYVDPACFDMWSIEEVGAVLIHEVHHVLRDHAGRARQLGVTETEQRRFNIAADLEINDDLTELPLPAGGAQPRAFGLSTGELAETYYQLLGSSSHGGWGDCGGAAHGIAGDWELPGSDESGVSPGEGDLIRQQVAESIRRRSRAGESVGPGLERWATAYLAPRVDWRRVLAGAVRSGIATVAGRVDYTYGRPSRRSGSPASAGVILPSLVQPVPDVAVVIDTSGSMDGDLLGRALAEIAGLLRACGTASRHLAVLSCDSQVHTAQRIFTTSEVRLLGGGGTDMRVAISAAVALRPRPQALIVLTDGLTPWPEARPPVERVIVALLGTVTGREPTWADVVEIST